MKAVAEFELTRDIHFEAMRECRRHSTWWSRFGPWLTGVLFVSGAVALMAREGASAVGTVLAAFGIFQLATPLYDRWKAGRFAASQNLPKLARWEFNDDGIRCESPTSKSEMAWEGVARGLKTSRGLLLWPAAGVMYYIPLRYLQPSTAADEIVARASACGVGKESD